MDLNFYSDLTDGTGQHDGDPEFLDPQSFNGFDSDNKVIPISRVGQMETMSNSCIWVCLFKLEKKKNACQ